MSAAALKSLSPYVVATLGVVVLLAGLAVRRSHGFAAVVAGVTCWTAALIAATRPWGVPGTVGALFDVDRYALASTAVLFASAGVIVALAHSYLAERTPVPEEFYVLLVLATLGGSLLAASSDFVSLFLALETMSVGMYGLIAYARGSARSLEAGLKYLVLASVSAAVLLFGGALVYFATGATAMSLVPTPAPAGADEAIWLAGMLLVLTGLAFKLALVPLHMWTADVYEGSAIPSTAFVATISKGAALAALFRIYAGSAPSNGLAGSALIALAVLSIVGGNLLALRQDDIKRLLGYSSIAQMGYLLVPVAAGGVTGAGASILYFTAYAIAMLAALGSLGALHVGCGSLDEPGPTSELRGLFGRRPWIAALLSGSMLSLAGLPLTAGFVGKFYLVVSGVGGGLWALLVALVVGSVVSLYYYLRVVYVIFTPAEEPVDGAADGGTAAEARAQTAGAPSQLATKVVLALLGLALVGWGILPEGLLRLIGFGS
jgi:NADH-quinone oxidoreductase subunit N